MSSMNQTVSTFYASHSHWTDTTMFDQCLSAVSAAGVGGGIYTVVYRFGVS